MNPSRNNGFTLVEMSAVLVVIGLIIGSILLSQSMIRTSQIRSMLGEYDSYVKAIKEFQDKYYALPGDMNNAETIWGTNTGHCDGTPSTTRTTLTCNGDGNGTIGSSNASGFQSNDLEWFWAWQQLSDAGFINGTFTGTPGSGGVAEATLGLNVPASQLPNAGWTLNYFLMTSDGVLWGDTYGHLLNMGGFISGDYTKGPVLTPAEAAGIDQKIDDGNPGTGKIRPWRTSVLPNCTANDTSQTAQTYNLTNNSTACSLIFILGM